jgi:hypothetical protein
VILGSEERHLHLFEDEDIALPVALPAAMVKIDAPSELVASSGNDRF